MLGALAVVVGAVLALGVGLWSWIGRDGRGKEHELGTISGQWIAEHRSQERQSDHR